MVGRNGLFQCKFLGLVVETVNGSQVIFGSEEEVYLDVDKLTFPLKMRPWKEGDRFQPLGMKNNKKLSDFLIDIKVPLAKKRQVIVLESEGEIIWVVGYRIADHAKVTDQTTRALKLVKLD